MQTKQQKRAKFALEKIRSYLASEKPGTKMKPEDFHDLAKFLVTMPNMILSNGLGQTLAFLLSKKDKQDKKETFNIIKEWIQSPENSSINIDGDTPMDFLTAFSKIDQKKYIDVQSETLRLMEWLKRYARAFDEKA